MTAFFCSLFHLTLLFFSLSNRKFLRVFYACFPLFFYIYFHLLFNLFSSAFLFIFSSTFLPIFPLFFYLSFPLHFYLFFPCLATYLSLTFQPFFPVNSLPFQPSLPLPHLTFLPLCLPHPSTPFPMLAFLPPYLPAHLSLNPEVSLVQAAPRNPLAPPQRKPQQQRIGSSSGVIAPLVTRLGGDLAIWYHLVNWNPYIQRG